jgi:probable phosphomutase (TIGR03848 family)
MTELLLIRHAVNDYVKTGRLAGWTPGVHLNDEGRTQAQQLAQRLDGLTIHAIYSSPLDRALETAEPLARPRDLPLRILQNIGEVHYGEWTGAELKELAKQELWMGVQFFPSTTRFPSGESIGEMQARAVAQCEALRVAHPDEVVAVVSHSDVIKAIVAHYIGLHLDLFQRLDIAPASLTWLHLGKMGARLVLMNDTGSVPRPPERKPETEAVQPETAEVVVATPNADGGTGSAAPAGGEKE